MYVRLISKFNIKLHLEHPQWRAISTLGLGKIQQPTIHLYNRTEDGVVFPLKIEPQPWASFCSTHLFNKMKPQRNNVASRWALFTKENGVQMLASLLFS